MIRAEDMPKPPMILNQNGVYCKNYTGLRSGSLVLLYPTDCPKAKRNNRNQYWRAMCDCGETHTFQGRLVVNGKVTTCPNCRTV